MSDASAESPAGEEAPLVLPAWAVGVPAVLLLGFLALFGRAGVGIQVTGLPLGAYLTPLPSVLVAGLITTSRGRMLLRSFDRSQRRVAIAVAVAVAAGLLRAAVQGMPTLLRFQDMTYLLRLPWIVVGMAAMKTLASDEERARVLRWLAWTLAFALTLHWARSGFAQARWMFEQVAGGLMRLSDKPDYLTKDSDRALHITALAALAIHLTRDRSRRGIPLVIIAGLLAGTHFSGFFLGGSRGALVGTALGGALLLSQKTHRDARTIFFATATAAFVVSTTAALATVPESHGTPPQAEAAQGEVLSILDRYELVAGRRSVSASIGQLRVEDGIFVGASTVGWRLAIWQDVLDEWNSSRTNQVFGIGFGNEIAAMTVPGRSGYDGLNRGVHSIAFTVLARQGLLGVFALTWILFALVLPQPLRQTAVLPVIAAGIIVGLFDVFLEGVQGPIFVWTMIGLAAGNYPVVTAHTPS